MQPFETLADLVDLKDTYPSMAAVLRATLKDTNDVRYAVSRLWLSEGIPYAFMLHPRIYEALRTWLARRLRIQAKDITLVGSGRLGYSLSPNESLGRPFGTHSDLDVSAISGDLFKRLSDTFAMWREDFKLGRASPRH